MFADKARDYQGEKPFRYFTRGLAASLTHKHKHWLKRLLSDKHSGLFKKLFNYEQKSIITLDPGHIYNESKNNFDKKLLTM